MNIACRNSISSTWFHCNHERWKSTNSLPQLIHTANILKHNLRRTTTNQYHTSQWRNHIVFMMSIPKDMITRPCQDYKTNPFSPHGKCTVHILSMMGKVTNNSKQWYVYHIPRWKRTSYYLQETRKFDSLYANQWTVHCRPEWPWSYYHQTIMEITTYLQSLWYSRRNIISMLSAWAILINWTPISYRKTSLKEWDEIAIETDNTRYTFTQSNEANINSTIILFNKPIWYTVSKADEHNQTIYDILPKEWAKRFYYIGRLDKDSHGLLLMTDSPKLVTLLAHPRYEHQKIYHVSIDRPLTQADMQTWKKWVQYFDTDENKEIDLKRKDCTHIANTTYEITLTEWKKRHIRRLFRALWYEVIDLCRYSFGPRNVEWIKQWEWKEILISSWAVESLLESGSSYIPTQI